MQDLIASLRADGYLVQSHTTREDATAWPPETASIRWTLEPLGGDEIPLPPQSGFLQLLLEERGLTVAATHLV